MTGKQRSLARVTVAYTVAIGAAAAWLYWGPSTGRLWLDTFIADVLATLVVFVFSRLYRNSSCYDAYWSVIPPLLLIYWWSQSPPGGGLQRWLVLVVVLVWAVRLTANWVYTFPGLNHEDWRYPLLRGRAPRAEFLVDLVAIHLIPTVQVFLGMLPVYVTVTSPGSQLVWLTWVAFVVGLVAVALELVADTQLHRFVAERRSGAVLDRGVWSWSRHPNYFGEFGFWFAMALFGVAASPSDAWWLFVGTAVMLAMFLGASIPMMEERSLQRRPGYADVINRVPRFVPRPPAAGGGVSRPRVVVAGLGDSGVLTAIRLAQHVDVVGISGKPALVSGQELGVRLARPDDWARDYWISFDRFRGLDRVRTVHGTLTGVDFDARRVFVDVDGSRTAEHYDALVISTGVTNGFWRRPDVQSTAEIGTDLRAAHEQLAAAHTLIVVGGGAAAVSSAANLATAWPDKNIDLYFPGARALPQHHGRTWDKVRRRLVDLGVGLHPEHRAVVPDGFGCDEITVGPVEFSTGQPPATADAVLWAIGRVRPNTGWLPADVLDEDGFVRVTPDLRVPGHPRVFAVGDVAATDPLRSSARNRADKLVARNVRAALDGRPLRHYRPPRRRWGSVLGVQPDGLEVFAPNGLAFRFPAWSIDRVLQPWIVRRGIYRGIRD